MANTFLTDISLIELDDKCGMAYWLAQYEGGKGLLKKSEILPRAMEDQIHADLRMVAEMESITQPQLHLMVKEVLDTLSDSDRQDHDKMELLYRRLGLVVSFALYQEPRLRSLYETIPIDSSVVLDREPLWVITHPDRILKARSNSEIVYREYVPMPAGFFHNNWLKSWHYNIRLHAGIMAADEDLGETIRSSITYGQVLGMNMGYISTIDNRLCHPYVNGYRNANTGEWSHTIRDGKMWDPAPVWDFPGGLVSWVTKCGESVADNQFHLSPPTVLNREMLNGWISRRLHRERNAKTAASTCHTNFYLRSINFERRTAQCRPAHGDACPYLTACWGKNVENPIMSGEYVPNMLHYNGDVVSDIKVGEEVKAEVVAQ